MSFKDRMKSWILTLIISVIIIAIGTFIGNMRNKEPSLPSDYIKYTITDIQVQSSGAVAVVKSDKQGYCDSIDITEASIDKDVRDIVGSKLYFGDPAKHHNNPKEYLIIKEK